MRKFWPKHINKEIARLLELLRLRFSSTSAHKEWPLPTAAPSHNAMAPCTLANGPNGAHLTRADQLVRLEYQGSPEIPTHARVLGCQGNGRRRIGAVIFEHRNRALSK